jgi:hypothetical protein
MDGTPRRSLAGFFMLVGFVAFCLVSAWVLYGAL